MENTVCRIKQFIDFKGISIRRFEENVGFSNGSFASQYKNNKTIGVDKVENILKKYPEINAEWLLTGEGEMLKKDSIVNNVIEGNNSGIVGNNTGHISFIQGLTTEQQVMQDNLSLQYEIKMKDKEMELKDKEINMKNREIEILERDIISFKDSLERERINQESINKLYERKIEDLKRTINILETRMESGNKNQM